MGSALNARGTLALAVLMTLATGCGGPRPEAAPAPAPEPTVEVAAEAESEEATVVEPTPSETVAAEPPVDPDAPAPPVPDLDVEPWRAAGETAAAHWDAARVEAEALAVRDFQPDDYWATLLPIVEAAAERFRLAEVGRSVEGRPIRRVDFGRGATTVLLWSQMHGNESTASRSLVDLLAFLRDHPDDPRVERIETALALTVVPVLNPDGAARFRRQNAVGIDINRDARALATPEARILKQVRDEIDAVWGFNLHDQNVRTRLGSSGRDVLIALLAPPPGPGETSPANQRARRMCSLLSVALEPVVGDQVARYDESFNPRAFGDLMAAWGTSTVLIESGGELADPHKARLRKANFAALLVALDAIADGSWEAWSQERYFALPLNAPWVHDVLVRNVRIQLPGAVPVTADLAIGFADTLAQSDGRIEEVGDLAEASALREIDADGLYFVPDPAVLGSDGSLRLGARASGVLSRDPEGLQVVYRVADGIVERAG